MSSFLSLPATAECAVISVTTAVYVNEAVTAEIREAARLAARAAARRAQLAACV